MPRNINNMNKSISEKELAIPVIEWLQEQHWDVYQEVAIGKVNTPVADIIAVQNNYVWAIEVKKSFTWRVLEQASRWRTHYRSIAILESKNEYARFQRYKMANEYYKLGIITIDEYYRVEQCMSPPLMREYHRFAKNIMKNLHEEQKNGAFAQAGSDNGGYFTPYRHTMMQIKEYISENPGCTLREIMNNVGKGHYANMKSAKSNIRTSLKERENDWCDIVNGKYYIKTQNRN